jgi:hypothetical protein
MSLSTCASCGGHIPLGPDATNRCEKCGLHVMDVSGGGGSPNAELEALRALLATIRREKLMPPEFFKISILQAAAKVNF